MFDKTPDELRGKKWVLTEFTHPVSGITEVIDPTAYLTGCTHKFEVEFLDKGVMRTMVNTKHLSLGYYRVKDRKFSVCNSRVSSVWIDASGECHSDAVDRDEFYRMMLSATSYRIDQDNLIINFSIRSTSLSRDGIVTFKRIDNPAE
ncbi:hypothetical protein QNI16_36250 [Cytophagaceae bacterium YF14B1]|uniref:Uncharacterized protein n=1 Tax=Xanthocytophaga flava TaxID=3048013 RepID=A0AAE3QYR0_9BACT|nr:hypothetical protein [Xanthocytophaga flavus]MDJ1485990.1 hypothetical protein [Xanthocytophaga flavus]